MSTQRYRALQIVEGQYHASAPEEIEAWQYLIDTDEIKNLPEYLQVKAARHISKGVCTPNGDQANDEAL